MYKEKDRETTVRKKINVFPFQRKEGVIVRRGRRLGCMGGGVTVGGSNMIYD